ncbi:cobalamin biosynthesis protein [Candidatus Bathyarchaeota archaeon]|nr:MAG: cobalamin biosynthesis protein [Candidatus Bathyarchaeota archaeon]
MLQFLFFSVLKVNLLLLVLALILDIFFGEPPPKIHPTVWIGRLITFLEQKLRVDGSPRNEKIRGIFLVFILTIFCGLICHLTLYICYQIHFILFLIVGVFLLKSTFAIRSMRNHVIPVVEALNKDDLIQARKLVARIVSRDTSSLDKEHVISATVESIAENIVDGVTSPLFYFSLFGVVGAFIYRAINTLDSMVGYKNPYYLHFGWFSATVDTIANFIPARITGYLMILSSIFVRGDRKYAYKIFRYYRSKTESLNSGWLIAAMAGVLKVRLEKPGVYKIGENLRELSTESIHQALHVMQTTIFLFIILTVIPILALYILV